MLARAEKPREDIRLAYVGDDGTLTPFESFGFVADDLAGEKPYSCVVSRNVSHLACHYWGDVHEGLVVWRLLGGNHRFERQLARGNATSIAAAASGDAVFITTRDNEVLLSAGGRETVAATLDKGWTLGGFDGKYLSAFSVAFGEARIWRFDPEGRMLQEVADGPATMPPLIDATRGRALFAAVDGLTMRSLATGETLWTNQTAAISVALAEEGGMVAALVPPVSTMVDPRERRDRGPLSA